MVSKNIDVCGYNVVPSFFNTKHFLYICPGHNSAYIRSRGVSQVPMNGFDSMYILVYFVLEIDEL
jgi:hypothetical protein